MYKIQKRKIANKKSSKSRKKQVCEENIPTEKNELKDTITTDDSINNLKYDHHYELKDIEGKKEIKDNECEMYSRRLVEEIIKERKPEKNSNKKSYVNASCCKSCAIL